ncbi:MAG TPA: hypothetical protein VGM31_08780 [Puia sp.]
MRKIYWSAALLAGIAACHNHPQPAVVAAVVRDSVKVYKAALLDSKKDPACGMPSTAGMEDTLHVNGKVIGFCSKECKQAYLKAPKEYKVEWK